MADLTDAEIDAALERGRKASASEPRATAATFDRTTQKIAVTLSNGVSVSLPPSLIQGLAGATLEEIAEVQVQARGYGLHWPSLDVDVSVPGLLAGAMGTRSYMAKRAGQARSKAKAAAARKNGAKGGRPRKVASG